MLLKLNNKILNSFVLSGMIASPLMGLVPLKKSKWAAEHQKELPFESCEFVSHETPTNGFTTAMEAGRIFVSESHISGGWLWCESPSLDIGYFLPITMGRTFGIGLASFGISGGNPEAFATKYNVTGLENKTVDQVSGKYKGFAGGGAFVLGAGASGVNATIKKSGINISYSTLTVFGFKFGVDLRYELADVKTEYTLIRSLYNNQFVLFDDPNADRPLADEKTVILGINLLRDIGDYKFVKIDPNAKK